MHPATLRPTTSHRIGTEITTHLLHVEAHLTGSPHIRALWRRAARTAHHRALQRALPASTQPHITDALPTPK